MRNEKGKAGPGRAGVQKGTYLFGSGAGGGSRYSEQLFSIQPDWEGTSTIKKKKKADKIKSIGFLIRKSALWHPHHPVSLCPSIIRQAFFLTILRRWGVMSNVIDWSSHTLQISVDIRLHSPVRLCKAAGCLTINTAYAVQRPVPKRQP